MGFPYFGQPAIFGEPFGMDSGGGLVLPAPTLVSPDDDALLSTTTPTLVFTTDARATSWRVQIGTAGDDFASPVLNVVIEAGDPGVSIDGLEVSYTLQSALDPADGPYEWRAATETPVVSAWSEVRSFDFTYDTRVLYLAPFAYWPLSETTGTQATDVAGGFHGTYNNVTLNATTFPDGTPAPLFDASNERVALPAVALDTPFDPTKGTLACWLRVREAGVWTDGVSRVPVSLGADANNRAYFNKPTVNNRLDWFYNAGGTSEQSVVTSFSPTTWIHVALTWDTVADEVKAYLNGAQNGIALTTLGTWSGSLTTTLSAIGNFTSAGGANFWDGYIKHVAAWNRALTPGEIASLAPAPFLA